MYVCMYVCIYIYIYIYIERERVIAKKYGCIPKDEKDNQFPVISSPVNKHSK